MDKEHLPDSPKSSDLAKFWRELKRRKVVRVAAVYAVVGWLVVQVAVSTFPSLNIPGWGLNIVIMSVILGFPISLVLTWAFEMSPGGIKSDAGVGAGESVAPAKGQKHNYITMGLVVLVLTFLVVERYLFDAPRSSLHRQGLGRLDILNQTEGHLEKRDRSVLVPRRNTYHIRSRIQLYLQLIEQRHETSEYYRQR